MIMNAIVPSYGTNVNPNQAIRPYIQIGLETGQSSWEMDVNCPDPDLFNKTHHLFKGDLRTASDKAQEEIEMIAGFARLRGWPTYVVYEAGAFGQKLGRDINTSGAIPVQLVARNIEYVRFGNQKDIPKTDRLDSQRQSHIPLDHPELPYADVQHLHEEERRDLFNEKKRLEKDIRRHNDQMCAQLRSCHIGTSHRSVASWMTFLPKLDGRSSAKIRSLENLLSQLNTATEQRQATHKLLQQRVKEISENWQPPNPDAQPAEPGRHPLQALGENSPLRQQSLPEALLAIKGIGDETVLAITSLVGDPRRFKSKKAFRAYLALVPTPYRSCSMRKSLGMKRGNPKLRKLMIQLAWRWCHMHPDSHLAKKYLPKLTSSRRSKKIAVCALAGELAELLYNHLVHGKQIAGLNVNTH